MPKVLTEKKEKKAAPFQVKAGNPKSKSVESKYSKKGEELQKIANKPSVKTFPPKIQVLSWDDRMNKWVSNPLEMDKEPLKSYAFRESLISPQQLPYGKHYSTIKPYLFQNKLFLTEPTSEEKVSALLEAQPNEQNYDICDLFECLFRVQNPHDIDRGADPNNPLASRVTRLEWNTSDEAAAMTMNNFTATPGTNLPLWIYGRSLITYAGFVSSGEAQAKLDNDESIISIITPTAYKSGAIKYDRVSIPKAGQVGSQVSESNIVNIKGTLDYNHLYYTTFKEMKQALKTRSLLEVKNGNGSRTVIISCAKADLGLVTT